MAKKRRLKASSNPISSPDKSLEHSSFVRLSNASVASFSDYSSLYSPFRFCYLENQALC